MQIVRGLFFGVRMKNISKSRFAAYGFIGLALSMISFFLLDERLYHLTRATDESSREMWLLITDLGSSSWMVAVTLPLWLITLGVAKFKPDNPLWIRLSRQSLFVFAAFAISGIFTLIVKGIVGRARPYLFDTEGPAGFNPLSYESIYASWPSGHTTTAFAFAIAIVLLAPRTKWIAIPFAILAGYSRMPVEAHYLGDVIMGATVGTIGAILVYQWLAPKLKL